MKSYPITFAAIQVAVALTVLWICFFIFSVGGWKPDSELKTLTIGNIAYASGICMFAFGFMGLGMLWAAVRESRKTINEQQNQIDELKRELESLKQDRGDGTQ